MPVNKSSTVLAKVILGIFLAIILAIAYFQVQNYRKLNEYIQWSEQEVNRIPQISDLKITNKVHFYDIGRIQCGKYFSGTYKSTLNENELMQFFESNSYRKVEITNELINYAVDYPGLKYSLPVVFETKKVNDEYRFSFVTC